MIECILGAALTILGLAFFVVVTVVKAKIGWSFINPRDED